MRGHTRSYELKEGRKQWAIVLFLGKASNGKRRYRWIRGFRTRRAADTEMRRVLRYMDDGTMSNPPKKPLAPILIADLPPMPSPTLPERRTGGMSRSSRKTSSPRSARSCSRSSVPSKLPNSTATR